MMTREAQNFVTILTKIHPAVPHTTLKRIDEEIKAKLGNYPNKKIKTEQTRSDVESKLDKINLIHFASMHVIRGRKPQEPHYLFLELTVDGTPNAAIDLFVTALEEELKAIYQIIDEHLDSVKKIRQRLKADVYEIKRTPWPTLFNANSVNGLAFSGTVGLDLGDMSDDAVIAEFAQDIIQDINVNSDSTHGNQGAHSTPSPNEIFAYIKKRIVEDQSNSKLSRAWKQATTRQMTPNFAEKIDSNWREDWNQVKLFTSIIPTWLKLFGLFTYLAVFFLVAYFFNLSNFDNPKNLSSPHAYTHLEEYNRCLDNELNLNPEQCSTEALTKETIKNWDTIRYTGSPFCKDKIEWKIQKCTDKNDVISLYPWFLIHGILWAFLLFFALRIAPPLFRRAPGVLTLLFGFNLYLWFPTIFNFNRFSNAAPIPSSHSFLGFVALIIVLFLIYLTLLMVRKFLNFYQLKFINKLFNATHQWAYFAFALILLIGYIYLGVKFFAGYDLLDPSYNKTYTFDYKHIYGEPLRIEQYILVPSLLSLILCLNIHAIRVHQPNALRHIRWPFITLQTWLGKYSDRIKTWNIGKFYNWASLIIIYAISHYSIYILAFHQNSEGEEFTQIFKNSIKVFSNSMLLAFILGVFTSYVLSVLTSRVFSNKSGIILATIFWLFVLNNFAGDHSVYVYVSLLSAIPVTLIIILIFIVVSLVIYGASQHRNKQNYDNPYTDVTEELFENENRVIQNHMISVQRLIPENFRRFITLPLMLQAIGGTLGKQRFRPGFLANVGTVHSARWIHLPYTDNYVFVSNYDGSFESYLEDFAKQAVEGTNLAWGNCIGFPKIKGLFKGGVQDSDRFKRYARRSMQPTPFWYSAVSDKSAEQLRRNALIRDGLTQDSLSSSQAQAWLDLFASIPRPEWVIETDKVQNLVFGANGFLTEGGMFSVKLSSNYNEANLIEEFAQWVESIKEHITFDGERPKDKATYIAFSAKGLRALGLSEVLDDFSQNDFEDSDANSETKKGRTFSQPFVSGMSDTSRRHILGDIADNDPANWKWSDKDVLAVVLVYDKETVVDKNGNPSDNFSFLTSTANFDIEFEQKFKSLAGPAGNMDANVELNAVKTKKKFHKEPFGFADGISQPILKGTKAGLKNKDSIHIVEPGEFILGYKDNSGYYPPSPVIDARQDVRNLLPNPTEGIVQRYPDFRPSANPKSRDLGRNGSYLVIRKLEQDVEKFQLTAHTGAALLLLTKVKDINEFAYARLNQQFRFNSFQGKLEGLSGLDSELKSFFVSSKLLDLETINNKISKNLKLRDKINQLYETEVTNFDVVDFLKTASPSKDRKLLKSIFETIKTINNGQYKTPFLISSEKIQALFMGRHKDGTSLVDEPLKILEQIDVSSPSSAVRVDDSTSADKSASVNRDVEELKKENEFLFRDRDPQGYKCPFGAHARRANPRDGLDLESEDSLAVTQRHRILRRGRSYEEIDTTGAKRQGTFFMCLNADIDRQFELLQQTWLISSKFHGLREEIDPVAGQGQNENASKFTIQHPAGDIQIPCMSNFVQVKAGGYFFLPGKETLDFIASMR